MPSDGISPAVMLSPYAKKRVRPSLGGLRTVTAKVQGVAARAFASVTVQVTVVVPTAKAVPAAGVQVGPVSGVEPPMTTGEPYDTATGSPSSD